MPLPQISGPHIKFRFEGMVAFCVAENSSHFDVGIIKDANSEEDVPNHVYSIVVRKLLNGVEQEIKPLVHKGKPAKSLRILPDNSSQLNLAHSGSVQSNQAGSGIELFTQSSSTYSSASATDKYHDFDLVVNIEEELYDGEKVKLNKDALRSVLKVSGITKGVFFTGIQNEVPLFTDHPQHGNLGYVAFSAEALVQLEVDMSVQKYDKKRGSWEVEYHLKCDPNVTYEIVVSNVCQDASCSLASVINFYNALIPGSESGKRILFLATPGHQMSNGSRRIPYTIMAPPPPTPETGCPTLRFSLKEYLPSLEE